jgi:hypothetical protein
MARSSNRGGNRGSRNNNPSGRNQYSSSGVVDLARDRPIAAAAVAAGAAAAGLFLWSRRSQISEQLSNLSDQIGEWTESMSSGSDMSSGDDQSGGFMARSGKGRSGKSQSDIAEEALTLKSTGKKSKRPADPTVDQQTETGAVAY